MSSMTPQEIVSELDRFIIGQKGAKRAVAIALRNRWRRQQVDEKLRPEITPKNILMIGPTGVGKTEIARRLARLANAPFIKIEATKFTEVGYVGRDVDTIIRDLMEIAIKDGRERAMKSVRDRALDAAEDRVLDALLPPARPVGFNAEPEPVQDSSTRQKFRKKLREGELDDKEIEIEVAAPSMSAEIFAPPGMEELTQQIQGIIQSLRAGADEAVQIASLGIEEAEQGVQQVLQAQQALQGIGAAVERITDMSQQMAAASQEQSHVAESVSEQINSVAATVQRTAENASAGVVRGAELENISSGLRALVERFNR